MKWRREPLVAFILLGVGIFALYRLAGREAGAERLEIAVTAGQIDEMKRSFAMTWTRSPTPDELEKLIEDFVRTEVLAREAVAMGLDRDDTIVRRRLALRMDALAEDLGHVEPSDNDLEAYLASHPDAFRTEPQFTFKQIYFNPNRRGASLDGDVSDTLAKLGQEADVDIEALGDGALLPHDFTASPRREVVATFGEDFAARLSQLELGKWRGPIPSGYGVHLVLVLERVEAKLPPLAEVRAAVHREWTAQQTRSARDLFYQTLRSRYVVTLSPDAEGVGR